MESDLFQKQLYLNEDKLFTKIHFNTGLFAATDLTPDRYRFVTGSTLHSFNRQIGRPMAIFQLESSDKLLIAGLSGDIVLPAANGINYNVSITNLPPQNMASVDHFGFYYDIFKDKSLSRYMPVMAQKSGYNPRPALCEAVVLTKSKIID